MNRIVFCVSDRPKQSTVTKVWPLVDFTIKNISFLPFLCDGLLKFRSINAIEQRDTKRNMLMIDGWIEHIPLNNPDDEKILPDFKTKFKSIYMDCDHEELSNRRGMILELLVNSFVAARYRSYPTYSRGCIVQLNSKQLIRERKTVDIAGWNGKIVELYETKVGPDLFGFEVLDLLCYIKKNLDCAKVCSIVGCITMAKNCIV